MRCLENYVWRQMVGQSSRVSNRDSNFFSPQKDKTAQFCISYLQVFYGVGRKRFYDGIMRDKKLRRVNLVCQIYSVPLTEEQEVKFLGKFEPH